MDKNVGIGPYENFALDSLGSFWKQKFLFIVVFF